MRCSGHTYQPLPEFATAAIAAQELSPYRLFLSRMQLRLDCTMLRIVIASAGLGSRI